MNNIILIDDHKMMRQGLKSFLSQSGLWNVVGEADSLESVKELLTEKGAELENAFAIVDVNLGMGGYWF